MEIEARCSSMARSSGPRGPVSRPCPLAGHARARPRAGRIREDLQQEWAAEPHRGSPGRGLGPGRVSVPAHPRAQARSSRTRPRTCRARTRKVTRATPTLGAAADPGPLPAHIPVGHRGQGQDAMTTPEFSRELAGGQANATTRQVAWAGHWLPVEDGRRSRHSCWTSSGAREPPPDAPGPGRRSRTHSQPAISSSVIILTISAGSGRLAISAAAS